MNMQWGVLESQLWGKLDSALREEGSSWVYEALCNFSEVRLLHHDA